MEIDKYIAYNNKVLDKLNKYNNIFYSNTKFYNKNINKLNNFNDDYLLINNISNDIINTIDNSYQQIDIDLSVHYNINNYCIKIMNIVNEYDDIINNYKKTEHFNIDDEVKNIVSSVSNKLSDTFKSFKTIFSDVGVVIIKIFKPIFKVFNYILRFYKYVFDKVQDNLPFIKEMFLKIKSIIIKIYNFTANTVIPFLKTLIKLIIKNAPKIIKLIIRYYLGFIFFFPQTFIPALFMFVCLVFGIQLYLKKLTNLEQPISTYVIIIFSWFIVQNYVAFKGENLVPIQNKIIDMIIYLLKSNLFKKIFKLSDNFGINNLEESLKELALLINNNIGIIIGIILLTLILTKILLALIIKKSFKIFLPKSILN